MAARAASAQSITTTETLLFGADGYACRDASGASLGAGANGNPCMKFRVECDTGSANPLSVRIDTLHGTGSVFKNIAAGAGLEFVGIDPKIHQVTAKGSGGTATASWCVLGS